MRNSDAAVVVAERVAADARNRTSMQLVCLALALSVVALACRILSVW
jgi:hypothetical protein